MKKTLSATFAVAALALTAACSDTVERPTASEVSTSLKDESSVFGSAVPMESADCFAEVLFESNLSAGTLRAVVEGDKEHRGSRSDQRVIADLSSALVGECAPATL